MGVSRKTLNIHEPKNYENIFSSSTHFIEISCRVIEMLSNEYISVLFVKINMNILMSLTKVKMRWKKTLEMEQINSDFALADQIFTRHKFPDEIYVRMCEGSIVSQPRQ